MTLKEMLFGRTSEVLPPVAKLTARNLSIPISMNTKSTWKKTNPKGLPSGKNAALVSRGNHIPSPP
jgi:hypothetical protein